MDQVGNIIYEALSGDGSITAMVGTRFYQGLIPQSDRSALQIRYFTMGVMPNDTKCGVSPLDEVTVRVDIFGKIQEDVERLSRRVRRALDRLEPGNYGGVSLNGVRCSSADMLPEAADATDRYLYTLIFEFRIDRIKTIFMDYLTTEQDTGINWIDGERIYQQTFTFSTPGSTVNFSGITTDYYVIAAEVTQDGRADATPFITTLTAVYLSWDGSQFGWTHGLGTSYPIHVTLWYTK